MSTKILVLTAGFGEGHNAAARAVAEACNALVGTGTAEVIDVFALASPRINALVRRLYLGLINRAPSLWSDAYRWLDRSDHAPSLFRMLALERRTLRRLLVERNPAILCSTYPIYGFILDQLVRKGMVRRPHYSVVTDSISINSLWWRATSDGWFMPNEDSADILRRAGLPERKIQVLGFPVNPRFSERAPSMHPPDLRNGVMPKVLYIVNSGTARAAETARRLLHETDWEVTCTVGRNEELGNELRRLAARRQGVTRILGWTNEIPDLLMSHHVVISKAGGATTQEAIAACCPMIVNQIIPGQEEGNYELLRRHGVGTFAEKPEEVVAALRAAFADEGSVWRRWKTSLQPISRPSAARDIANSLLGLNRPPAPAVAFRAPSLPGIEPSRLFSA